MSNTQDPTAGMTPEQKEEFERNWYTSNITALDFMEAHLLDPEGPLVRCQENANAIGSYVMAHQLSWTIESLDRALADLSALGKIKRGTPVSDELWSKKQTEEEKQRKESAEAKATEWPWGRTLEGREGTLRVKGMSGPEYRSFLNDKKYGKEFEKQVEALQITDKQLGRL